LWVARAHAEAGGRPFHATARENTEKQLWGQKQASNKKYAAPRPRALAAPPPGVL
jgi:hypothetical protein